MIFDYKGVPIFYTDKGKGSVIVLLHGFLENSSMWNHISKELSKTNRVICIDLLGHGKTGCLGYVHTMEDMAEGVKDLLKHLRLRRVIIIGHSMGGYVALAFVEKYFNNVKALCLLNSTSQADSEDRKELRLRACKMAQTNCEILVKMSVSNLFAEESRELFSEEIAQIKNEALKTPLQGYIAATKGMRLRGNKEKVLQKVPKRLIISGIEDPIIEVESIKNEAARTKTPLYFLPNGHMSHVEAKEALQKKIKEFIKQ